MGTTCYHLEDPGRRFNDEAERLLASGTKRNLSVRRCLTCLILFESDKRYPRKTCHLCQIEANEFLQKRYSSHLPEKYAHAIKRHRELTIIKGRIADALKCQIVVPVICLRDDEGHLNKNPLKN